MYKYNISIERECGENYKEFDLEITYNYIKGGRGQRDSYGVPIEPDDPGEIEIIKAIDTETKKSFDLTSSEEEHIIETLWNDLPDPDYREYERD